MVHNMRWLQLKKKRENYVLKWNDFQDPVNEKSKANSVLNAAVHVKRKCGEEYLFKCCLCMDKELRERQRGPEC